MVLYSTGRFTTIGQSMALSRNAAKSDCFSQARKCLTQQFYGGPRYFLIQFGSAAPLLLLQRTRAGYTPTFLSRTTAFRVGMTPVEKSRGLSCVPRPIGREAPF